MEPIHHAVWEKLDKQSRELYYLKKDNQTLRDALREAKKQNRVLRKQAGISKRRRNVRKVIEQYKEGAGAEWKTR